jgi:hypothetical protein
MVVKKRTWISGTVSGQHRSSIFNPWGNYSDAGKLSSETEQTFSHAHLNNRWSGGGPWNLSRDTTDYYPDPLIYGDNLTVGSIRIENPAFSWTDLPMYSQPSELQAIALGATGIARTLPTNPAFDLSVNLGELRSEGLPNLPGSEMREATRAARGAGGEYLNLEFGWLPIVGAVRDFAKTVDKSDTIIGKYQQDANHSINRTYRWPESYNQKSVNDRFSATQGIGFFSGGARIQTVSQKQWFTADYIYYLPTGGSVNDKIRRYGSYARKLLGVRLTPEVLWNLSPWSWAADWFGNMGDIMTNVSNIGTDGLVLRNAYFMSHSRRETMDYGRFNGRYQRKTRLEEFKLRRASTPYGFGVAFSSLSTKQVAIISALGLSKW